MASAPTFEHRHFVKIADILNGLRGMSPEMHESVIAHFADELRGTNPRYNRERFLDAARGTPRTRRDRVR